MATNKQIEKALKLKALAERGVGGEKENAKVMLKAYMKQHNITDTMLNLHSKDYVFDFSNPTSIIEFLMDIASELKFDSCTKKIILGIGVGLTLAAIFTQPISKYEK